jgi:Domain of unknown function (DUF309)
MKQSAYAQLPPWWQLLRRGAECFDAGDYWHAHEHWELAWKNHVTLHRHYVKGLIQLAAACYHVQRGKPLAARQLLHIGPAHLMDNHPLSWPFDTAHLLTVAAALSSAIERGRSVVPPQLGLVRMMDAWEKDHGFVASE